MILEISGGNLYFDLLLAQYTKGATLKEIKHIFKEIKIFKDPFEKENKYIAYGYYDEEKLIEFIEQKGGRVNIS